MSLKFLYNKFFLPNSKILTGIIKLESEYILHSVLEIKDKDSKKIKIIDWTRNLVIEKELYLKIFEFHILEEIEINYLDASIRGIGMPYSNNSNCPLYNLVYSFP